MLSEPKVLQLYVGFGCGNQTSRGVGTMVFEIDGATGVLTQTGNAGGGSENGRAIAMDARGRFFFDAWGLLEGFLDSGTISPVDGTSSSANQTINLGANIFPSSLLTESSGKFLYAQTTNGLLIYSIDQTSGALTLVNGPLAAFSFFQATTVADPMGPYVYSLGRAGGDVFQVDPQTGSLAGIPGRPFCVRGRLGLGIS